ncbi:iron-containing alcohol dehydrogenase [Planctopirus limnophila DSM 3776]|uniref:Iron-containing alcohol dehydrogenase n=1 Tax=Planctopirus limnophila (strain ATCC 43296 / DSM 3776 / IFAM 1008 / Mu 290) TaxID=521674 RepID=D5SS40_PLAL2|nr:iron-containing alcohol dehydrogenase [Planctopirus limnophila]ADG68764.1 iron-containing alcohol dehydrogenase [Planctopirus limnophila DSM 3776]
MTTRALGSELLEPFDYNPLTRVVYGPGSILQLGKLARDYGASRVVLFTDSGILATGHIDRCLQSLQAAGIATTLFSSVQPNPSSEDVDLGVQVAREAQADFLIAVGGGSSIDCAKGVNFVLTGGGTIHDYWGVGKARGPMLPLIVAPTTAGTGSEAQSYALISDAKTHVKMACGDQRASCKVAILDPELAVSMPRSVTAATGIDALSHAIESHVTTRRNSVSQSFSRRAFRLLAQALPVVLDEPSHLPARGAALLGAHWAGAAIENSMLGATHALANPLTATYGITHGVAIGIMLPHVIRYNEPVVANLYAELVASMLSDAKFDRAQVSKELTAGEVLACYVEQVVRQAGQPTNLLELGVEASRLHELAQAASVQWTGTFNPRPVDAASLEELYRCAFSA